MKGIIFIAMGVAFGCASSEEELQEQAEIKTAEKQIIANQTTEASTIEQKTNQSMAEQNSLAAQTIPQQSQIQAPNQIELEPTTAIKEQEPKSEVFYPTTSLLNVRNGPGTQFEVTRVLKFGEQIQLTSEQNGVWRATNDGQWVSTIFLSSEVPSTPNDPRDSVATIIEPEQSPVNQSQPHQANQQQ